MNKKDRKDLNAGRGPKGAKGTRGKPSRTKIFTITVIPLHLDEKGNRTPGEFSRCWGYEFSRAKARTELQKLDSEAEYYTHAVIEEYKPGVYTMGENEEWYEWRSDQWVLCSKPDYFRVICNHAIG